MKVKVIKNQIYKTSEVIKKHETDKTDKIGKLRK